MTRPLMQLMLVASAVPMLAFAQVAPAPAPPAAAPPRAARPAPAPRPLIAPRFDLDFEFAHEFELMKPQLDEWRFKAEEMRLDAHEMARVTELSMFDVAGVKAQVEAMAHVDVADIAARASERAVEALSRVPMHIEPFGPGFQQDKFTNARPPAPWAQEDPADSLYRVAREALNRGEYRRAAQTFNEVTRKFPKSRYAQDSAYWEAFARYRIGTTDELKHALQILEGKGEGVALQAELLNGSRGGSVDIPGLRARVLGVLASRGDRDAERLLAAAGQNVASCDREEISVRAEALNALGQMDIAAAMPTVKKVLQRRDECTVELRRRALYVVGRQPGTEGLALILDVAKNDPDRSIRGEAMRWLSRIAGDGAVPHLEELLKTSPDEQSQRSAISALGAIDSDVARRAVRTIIERSDAAERVRYDAILSLSRERDGRSAGADDMAYLRSLYGKMQTPRLKEAVLTAVSRVAAPENEQFLLSIARNTAETSQLRAAALQRLGRMETVKVADIAKLYEVADSRSMREQILSALSQRKEPEAIDKMIDIAKKDTDPQIRRYAINLLSRSNNERAKQFFQGLFDQ